MTKDFGVKDKKKGKKKGLKPKDRKLATKQPNKKLTANQWTNTPQQNEFMELWLNPDSQTFGNAYESALQAGYAPRYAMQLSAPSIGNKWITEYRKKLEFGPEHIKQGIQRLAIRANNSRSPDDTRLKAYETLAKIQGMLEGNTVNQQINIQPILGGSTGKQPIDIEPTESTYDT